MSPRAKRGWFAGVLTAWGGIIVAGLLLTVDRDSRPALLTGASSEWPADASISRPADRDTVLVFAHPHCPCTRATLRELEQVLSRVEETAAVYVLLCVPDGAPEGFAQSDLREQAQSIPRVIVGACAAAEARLFGARTSGEILVFGRDGELRFRGGITGSRGHEGANPGRSALIACLQDSSTPFQLTPVFGCSLLDDEPPARVQVSGGSSP